MILFCFCHDVPVMCDMLFSFHMLFFFVNSLYLSKNNSKDGYAYNENSLIKTRHVVHFAKNTC